MKLRPTIPFLLAAAVFFAACTTDRPAPPASALSGRTLKPVVAVTDFENKAGFTGKWKLGEGMAELLITQLMEREDVIVLERQHLQDVIGEILLQGKELFRPEGKVKKGRLKNARYLIRGSVTDFTVGADASGWFNSPSVSIWGGGNRARVTINAYITDVESGEIIDSVEADGKVSRFALGGNVDYKAVAFGGRAFFNTPLGRATKEALREAADELVGSIPIEYWQARIAEAGPDRVILNGGADVGLEPGDQFAVRGEGRVVTDPVTGDVIDRRAGPVIGRVEVTAVRPSAAEGVLLEGRARRGDLLEPVPAASPDAL